MNSTSWPERYFSARGITDETLSQWGVATTDDKIQFTYLNFEGQLVGVKTRSIGRNFVWSSGTIKQLPYGLDRLADMPSVVWIVEGESDTLKLWQEIADVETEVVGLPGCGSWQDEWKEYFKNMEVYVVLDNDKEPEARAMVSKAREAISRSMPWAKHIYLPDTCNDVSDFLIRNPVSSLLAMTSTDVKMIDPSELADAGAAKADHLLAEGWLKDYVDLFKNTTEAPVDYHIAIGLTILSLACSKAWINLGVNVPLNLYTLILGPSSSPRKSTAIKRGLKVLEVAKEYGLVAASLPMGVFTEEAISKQLAMSDRYPYLMAFDEFSSFMKAGGEHQKKAKEILLEAHGGAMAGKTTLSDSYSGGPVFLSLLAAMPQSVFYENFKETDITSGFLPRFLLVFSGNETIYNAFPEPLNHSALGDLAQRLAEIGQRVYGEVVWAKPARDFLVNWYESGRKRWAKDEDSQLMTPLFLRYDVNARKLAALLAVSETGLQHIREKDIVRTTTYVDATLTRIYERIGNGKLQWTGRKYQQLQDMLDRNPGASMSELHSKMGVRNYELKDMLKNLREDGVALDSGNGYYRKQYGYGKDSQN